MEPKYQPNFFEEKIYQFWEGNNYFHAEINKEKKPFSIILPPPNANADLHLGHAMYVYEDIMIRFYKLMGFEVLWLPGADHAGFETQYVFEKHLKEKGKSRFDYNREELYQMIFEFVMKNRDNMENQLRRLGFALDWQRKKFTLDADIIQVVYDTFKKLFEAGLVYRAKRLVNFCTFCGTSFSDLEVVYKEKLGKLYYIKYLFKSKNDNIKNKNYISVATTRPETLLGDTAVAVNPKDKRFKNLIGRSLIVPLVNREVKIIADLVVDPKFGTGAVKVTPAHDQTDWEISQRHNLSLIQVIDFDGRMMKEAGEEFQGLFINQAREKVVEKLKELNLIEKIDDYKHRVGHCYKCGQVIEFLPKEQWFIKIKPLAERAKEKVVKEKIKIYPKRFKKILLWWLDHFQDWNISRQVVWGIRIPAYKCQSKIKNQKSKIEKESWFVSLEKPKKCLICGNCDFKQDEDTFDTWFSSGQWPFATLASCSISNIKYQKSKTHIKNQKEKNNLITKQFNNEFFNYFYPTSVMETGYDILPWWVARMIMLGLFYTGKVPFKNVFLHGLVKDKFGQKMSKSKGNVINPMEMIDKYGADALRLALVYQVKEGNDQSLSEGKIVGMRNFINKVWNIGRFIYLTKQIKNQKSEIRNNSLKSIIIKKLKKEYVNEKKRYLKLMKDFKFSLALSLLYKFLWHRLADFYIERLKEEFKNGNIKASKVLEDVFLGNLIMLHPFTPFVTEAIWRIYYNKKESILDKKF
ncbi:MAG: valine--tRNA ligase [Patescibacteria group bacterium]|nr:valine--tRNA ligase [Patescibacteria group bacterium]